MTETTVMAWHFCGDKLRDGRPIPADGVTLTHSGKLVMCVSGLHASERVIDALQYAPGNTICRVKCGGKIERDTDKLTCTQRTVLWRVAGEGLLREFARACARDVLRLWDAPDVVKQYLKTGDEKLRDAARDAAWAAARDAAWAAAGAAARDAAGAAAWDAAWDAARDAAEAAAEAAAWAAARDAARAAAGAAARAKQNKRLEAMIETAREDKP